MNDYNISIFYLKDKIQTHNYKLCLYNFIKISINLEVDENVFVVFRINEIFFVGFETNIT